MSAVKTDQFRLGLWEFKSKVCFYSQEICDTWCVKIMNKQREFTDKMLYNCARLRVRRSAVWVMDKWLLDQWKVVAMKFHKIFGLACSTADIFNGCRSGLLVITKWPVGQGPGCQKCLVKHHTVEIVECGI